MNKRGESIIWKETIEVLTAVVAVSLLVVLMIRIFSPTLTVAELTAKNYLDSLKVALDEAKKTGSSEFLMYSSEPNPYFLVYFGEGHSFDKEFKIGVITITFKPEKAKKNNLCICYLEGDYSLDNVLDLEKGYICKSCIQEDLIYKDFFGYISGEILHINYFSDTREYEIKNISDYHIQKNLQGLIELIKEREENEK